jgi:hypothetical protein
VKLCRRTGFLRLKSNSTFVFPTEKEYELIGRLRRSVLKARKKAKRQTSGYMTSVIQLQPG